MCCSTEAEVREKFANQDFPVKHVCFSVLQNVTTTFSRKLCRMTSILLLGNTLSTKVWVDEK